MLSIHLFSTQPFSASLAVSGIGIVPGFIVGGTTAAKIWIGIAVWVLYAVILTFARIRRLTPRRMAIMAIIGFACVLFTYLGVNLLPSLHSYLI